MHKGLDADGKAVGVLGTVLRIFMDSDSNAGRRRLTSGAAGFFCLNMRAEQLLPRSLI